METEASLSAAQNWEAGCVLDACRNEFVAPVVVDMLAKRRPNQILDVGAGTGFVARIINEALPYSPTWTLLDCDDARLNVANGQIPSSMLVQLVHQDSLEFLTDVEVAAFDAILICFSLLEFVSYAELFSLCARALAADGDLILVLPDPWEEVLAINGDVNSLLGERVSINKIDKFTGEPYPYFISRTEKIIADLIQCGLYVTCLVKSVNSSPTYVLAFRKLPSGLS